jgi:signal peptidase
MAGNILIWIIVLINAYFLWPASLGGNTSLVIVSGASMEPEYFAGDLVIARDIEPSVGEVIVYAPEDLGGAQVVHRIIGGNAADGWELQGDNNDFIDPYTPKGDEVRGVVVVHYTNLGRLTALLLNPIIWACVLVVSIGLLLWISDDCDDEDEHADGDSDTRDLDSDEPDTEASAADEPGPAVVDEPVEATATERKPAPRRAKVPVASESVR